MLFSDGGESLVIVLLVMVGSCVGPILGFVEGAVIGWRWQRSLRGGMAGAIAGLLSLWLFVYLGYEARTRFGWGKGDFPGFLLQFTVLGVVITIAAVASLVVWRSGDARGSFARRRLARPSPNPAPPDAWRPPDPGEISRVVGDPDERSV
jgi:hypothetical protein